MCEKQENKRETDRQTDRQTDESGYLGWKENSNGRTNNKKRLKKIKGEKDKFERKR